MRLLISYCYSLYGCVIWDITNVRVEQVCSAWRTGVRRVWGLPFNTHNLLIPLNSNRFPLYDEIRKRMLTFIQNCLLSESDLVSFVTRHAVWFGRMSSTLGRNAFHCYCCRQFIVHLDDLIDVTPPNFVYNFCNYKVDNDSFLLVYSLLQRIFVRSGSFSLGEDFANTDVQAMIALLCTSEN